MKTKCVIPLGGYTLVRQLWAPIIYVGCLDGFTTVSVTKSH